LQAHRMEKLKIKSFVIENRSRISAANCFIAFSKSLDKHQTKVSLKALEIVIQVDDDIYKIETKKFFDINVKSFHSLLVRDNFISFRFITSLENQFDAEVLKVNGTCNKFQRVSLTIDDNKDEESVTITCSNCDSQLTVDEVVTLRRVLELPSSNLNVSDWFCHRHGDEKLFEDPQTTNGSSKCFNEETQQFQPKTNDVFYGPFCLLMNAQLFEKNRLRQKRKLSYCKRCLQLMGESSSSIVKFWWESVKISGRPFFNVASPINLVKNVIKNHLSSDGLGFLTPIVKIIFEASLPADDQKVHILIQVMDKNLQLLRLNLDDSKLVERRSIKVMYLKLKEDNDDDVRTLKYWQKDINIASFEFSIKMFHLFSEYLKAQSELIPEVYRTNNGFRLSYIEFM
jgi:hypothetical protein